MSLCLLFNGQREALFREGEAFLRKRGVIAPFHICFQDVVLNTLRTRSFKLFKRPFLGFLTILTL